MKKQVISTYIESNLALVLIPTNLLAVYKTYNLQCMIISIIPVVV